MKLAANGERERERVERQRNPTPKSHFGVGRESKNSPQKTNNLLNYLLNNRTWLVIAILITITGFSVWGIINNTKPAEADSANSGTNLPISKGGTGAGEKSDALKNLLPDLVNNDSKVLGLTSGTPTWINTGATLTSSNDEGKVKILSDSTMQVNKVYSTTEVDTGAKWIDGKPIYRRVFTGNIVAAANTSSDIILSSTPAVSDLINSYGWWMLGNAGTKSNINAHNVNAANIATFDSSSVVYESSSGELRFKSISAFGRSATTYNSYMINCEYTKL